jgi:transglutaminase-like putative cysteine protease
VRAQIKHLTEYHYPQAAWDSFNQVRLKPAQDDSQSLLSFRLEVQPNVAIQESKDYFGTSVHAFHVFEAHHHLAIESSSLVVKHPKPFPASAPASSLLPHRTALYEFLSQSQRVPLLDPARLEYKNLGEHDDLLEYLLGLNAHIKQRFVYQSGTTTVHTPLEQFLDQGIGVCQDFVHVMLGVCRAVGIPARYVSGYIYAGQDFLGAAATHAWLEAFVPNTGWIGLDPTNNVLETENHIKIGIGRDYDDIPPLHGLRRGGGLERLDVAVSVQTQQ